jgi:hypothetical protein
LARKKAGLQKQQKSKSTPRTGGRSSARPPQRRREHFGVGELAIRPETSVFINCPFDPEYAPLFDAIIFATTCCGFLARSALESGNVAEPRMTRIAKAVLSSKYSIHDLSRCRGEGNEGLARFNMPLELGIAMGRRITAGDDAHDWLILVPEGHGYVQFVSDLAGYDPKTHDNSVDSIVKRVIFWLATRKDAIWVPEPADVIAALPDFQERKADLVARWGNEVPWADLILAARECVPA